MSAFGATVALGLSAGLIAGPTALGETTWEPSTWTGVTAGAPVPGRGLPPAPMPAPLTPLAAGVTPVITYEPQTTCDSSPKPGALRVEKIITSTYGASQTVWIPRGCYVGDTSEHKEGRALDWMTSVRDPQQRANAEAFLNWLLGPDQSGRPYGHALQLGIMYIGWNDRIWRGYGIDRGWQELKDCFGKSDAQYDNYCHRNHIHISLTRQGATGLDPTGMPIQTEPVAALPAPEAPLAEPILTETAVAPAQPGPDSDLFMSIGSELGYRTTGQDPLQPGETRTIPLSSIPANATSALISVTTRKAEAETRMRVGLASRKRARVFIRVPEAKSNTSVLSVPVRKGNLQIGATKAPVQVQIDVLGYAVDNGVYPAVGAVPSTMVDGRFGAGEVVAVRARGTGAVPRKKAEVTAVILQVTTDGRGRPGRFAAYPLGGTDLGTRSAEIPAMGKATTFLVADIGRNGQIAFSSSVKAKVRVSVVGYVKR